MLKEVGGGPELTENWAWSVLKSMNWTKQKGTIGKVEPFKKFLEEEKFTFQRKISSVILYHDLLSGLVLNLDQTPLSHFPRKVHFSNEGVKKGSHQRSRW